MQNNRNLKIFFKFLMGITLILAIGVDDLSAARSSRPRPSCRGRDRRAADPVQQGPHELCFGYRNSNQVPLLSGKQYYTYDDLKSNIEVNFDQHFTVVTVPVGMGLETKALISGQQACALAWMFSRIIDVEKKDTGKDFKGIVEKTVDQIPLQPTNTGTREQFVTDFTALITKSVNDPSYQGDALQKRTAHARAVIRKLFSSLNIIAASPGERQIIGNVNTELGIIAGNPGFTVEETSAGPVAETPEPEEPEKTEPPAKEEPEKETPPETPPAPATPTPEDVERDAQNASNQNPPAGGGAEVAASEQPADEDLAKLLESLATLFPGLNKDQVKSFWDEVAKLCNNDYGIAYDLIWALYKGEKTAIDKVRGYIEAKKLTVENVDAAKVIVARYANIETPGSDDATIAKKCFRLGFFNEDDKGQISFVDKTDELCKNGMKINYAQLLYHKLLIVQGFPENRGDKNQNNWEREYFNAVYKALGDRGIPTETKVCKAGDAECNKALGAKVKEAIAKNKSGAARGGKKEEAKNAAGKKDAKKDDKKDDKKAA